MERQDRSDSAHPASESGAVKETPQAPQRLAGPAAVPPDQLLTTPSGLRFHDIVTGTGPSPTQGRMVHVHYTGWLKDGAKFDSSRDRGAPFSFVLGQGRVIKGWDEGVSTMRVGGVRLLVIPPNLAYGERGLPGAIPPNAELTFEVELLRAD